MRDVAIIGFAQTDHVRREQHRNEVEMLMPVLEEVRTRAKVTKDDIGFTCSGSTDYLAGVGFSFVMTLDGVGAWPPISESHVEMDGAWALYEAWLRLQEGDIEIAVVTGSGRSSTGDPALIYPMEMDPFFIAPIGADPLTFAALQARAAIAAGIADERSMAEVAVRSRRDAKGNPDAQVSGDGDVDALLREPYRRDFIAPRAGRERRAEAFDLAGAGREHALDLMAAALTPPVVCEPRLVTFASDGFWRGETHRLCDRPGAVIRLFDELAAAAVSQVIVVTAVPTAFAPHRLRTPRLDVRSRLGEFLAAAEAAALHDAVNVARLRFDSCYVVRPAHNPVGPFDVSGAYDEASDRRHSTAELMERGYEDAYHQFIEPIVGASGDQLARADSHEPSSLA